MFGSVKTGFIFFSIQLCLMFLGSRADAGSGPPSGAVANNKLNEDVCHSSIAVGRKAMVLAENAAVGGIHIIPLKNCDFVVMLPGDSLQGESAGSTFIENKKVRLVPSDAFPKFAVYEDNSIENVHFVESMEAPPIKYKGNSYLLDESSAWDTVPDRGCYFGPVSSNIRTGPGVVDRGSDARISVGIFEFLPSPVFVSSKNCMVSDNEKLKIRLKTKRLSNVWVMRDGGYLVLLDDDLLLRLDSRLNIENNSIPGKYVVAAVPLDLVGVPPVNSVLEMPVMKGFQEKCELLKKGCSLQVVHDELLSRLKNLKTRGK